MRRATSILLLALLVLPLRDGLPFARVRLQSWEKLRARHREAPDSGWDRSYGELGLYPAAARTRRHRSERSARDARAAARVLLPSYTLAPRLIVPGTDEEFVIMCGPASAAGSLLDLSRFVAVRQFDSDFTLYRRVRS